MNIRKYLDKFVLAAFITLAAASFSFAQNAKTATPRPEKLLNNLKLLMWQDAGGDKVSVKMRVHSGAAFDTLGKEGTMALLADALFPNEAAKEFFTEELGGSVEVTSNYDYIQINATGNANQILTILETIAAAVIRPTLDKETTAKIKTARLEKINALEKNPAYIADLAVAKRLFGDYPYGRSAEGTTESLAKIDFADLILAKQRFLTADNVTLAVSGNIKYEYVFKAVRQLFGGWGKADKKVPATFAQPSAPDANLLIIKSPDDSKSEMRFAFRNTARNDKDFWASTVLAQIMEKRFGTGEVRQNTNLLPGIFTVGISATDIKLSPPAQMTKLIFNESFAPPIKPEEFAAAKQIVTDKSNRKNTIDYWLDVDTYRIISVKTDAQAAQDVNLADVQRIADRMKKEPMVTVLATNKTGTTAPIK